VPGTYVDVNTVKCTVPPTLVIADRQALNIQTRVDGSDFSQGTQTFTVLSTSEMAGMVAGIVIGSLILVGAVVGVAVYMVVKRGVRSLFLADFLGRCWNED